jgi:methylglutamate dehydrogenase subunit D
VSDAAILIRSAFAGLATPGRFGADTGAPGVTLREITGLAMASAIARKGQGAALALATKRAFGVELPAAPRRVETPTFAFTWAGPQQWLVSAGGGDSDALAQRLAALFTGLAAVSAQGDGRAALRISGPRARDTLAKGLPLDLDASVFAPGNTALSLIMHVGVQITQIDAAPTYEIMLPRSFAGSFWHWLTLSAGEYGYEVSAPLAAGGRG